MPEVEPVGDGAHPHEWSPPQHHRQALGPIPPNAQHDCHREHGAEEEATVEHEGPRQPVDTAHSPLPPEAAEHQRCDHAHHVEAALERRGNCRTHRRHEGRRRPESEIEEPREGVVVEVGGADAGMEEGHHQHR